jgi:hypothetical protein
MTNKELKLLKVELEKVAILEWWVAYPDIAALVKVNYKGRCYDAIGWSTRGSNDKWNGEIGLKIAKGRAMDKIVRKILREV